MKQIFRRENYGEKHALFDEAGVKVALGYVSTINLFQAAPDMINVLEKWSEFMAANYRPSDITWWQETIDVIKKARGES